MKLTTVFALLILVTSACSQSRVKTQSKPSVESAIADAIEKHATALLKDDKISAVSIGLYNNGEEFIGHFGELDEGKNNKPSNETLYEIASVSKTMAGFLVAQGEHDGKLTLEDDIRIHLGDEYQNLEYKGHPIRIRHLITHTARLPRFLPAEINSLFDTIDETLPFRVHAVEKSYSRGQFFEDLKQVEVDTIPGIIYDYSNADTELLAHILESIYDKTYEELLKTYIFDKAGMPNSKIQLNADEKKHLPNGYGESRNIVPHMTDQLWGAGGGIKSTMPDLINYMKFQLDQSNELVQKTQTALHHNQNSSIGYYWPIRTNEDDGVFFRHHGGAFGTQNWFIIIPKHNIGFSIITNQSDQETAGKLLDTAADILEEIR